MGIMGQGDVRDRTGATMKIPGTYVDEGRAQHDVVVVDLSCAGCRVAGDSNSVAAGSSVRFFIGAIGPIEGRAEARSDDGLKISFVQPIEPRIVEHFASA